MSKQLNLQNVKSTGLRHAIFQHSYNVEIKVKAIKQKNVE